jgi:hypothetical protein
MSEPRSFADLDRRKAQADEADPLKPGMLRVDGKLYRMREDWADVMDRAAAKFGTPQPTRQARGVSR